jgi:DNA polymerase-4
MKPKAWLAPLPVSWLLGAGPKAQARLHQIGLRTIGEVAGADPKFLLAKLGKVGLHFHALAHAEDSRPVIGQRSTKNIGSERTLEKDISGKADLKPHLRRSADVIGRRLRQKRYVAFGVGVKLKTTHFQILTRQRRLSEPTDVTERLYLVGVDLLDEFNHPGPFRGWHGGLRSGWHR